MKKILILTTIMVLMLTSVAFALQVQGIRSKDSHEAILLVVENTSGGALADGDVVVWDVTESTGTNPAVTTTTSDDSVITAGVVMEAIADGEYGRIVVYGYHDAVKARDSSDALSAGGGIGTSGAVKLAGGGTGLGISLEAGDGTDTGTIEAFITAMGAMNASYTALTTLSVSGNSTLTGTLTQTGVATFAAKSIFTLGIDCNEEVDIDLDATAEMVDITTSSNPVKGAAVVRIYCSDSDVASQGYLLELEYTDNGDVDADFLICTDNAGADTMFSIGNEGNTFILGTLGVTGIATFDVQTVHTLGLDVNDSIDVDLSADSDDVVITMAVEVDSAGEPMVMMNCTDSDVDTQMFLLELQYTMNGDADCDFFVCSDAAGDAKFTIAEEGNTTIVGTLGVTGLITGTGAVFSSTTAPLRLSGNITETAAPASADLIGINSSFDVYVSTGTGIGAWVLVGGQT